MFVIHSMTQATILIAVTVYALLLLSMKGDPLRPLHAASLFVQELYTNRKLLLHLLGIVVILFFNKIEIVLENSMKTHSDFTPSFYAFEGDFIVFIQKWLQHDALTSALTYFYVVVFPAVMIASIILYASRRQFKLFYAVCYALMINYMVAIPFYLFFPVTEVHAFHPDVAFLMLDAFPTFESEYRPLSDLDNCFPSLHTSISVTMAMIALNSKNRFWKRFVPACAAIIIFSIFYLGVHWVTDMAGGVVLGLLAARIALRLSEGKTPLATLKVGEKKRNMESRWYGK